MDADRNVSRIVYREEHAAVNLAELRVLFESVGWDARAHDPARLRQLVFGSMYVASAHDGSEDGKLVGFARAISDGASNAYVSTVVVDAAYRKQKIGSELIRRLLAGKEGIQFVLHAAPKVHAFYKQLGFTDHPDCLVRRRAF